MMRGPGIEAMAVRKKDGSIHLESKEVPKNKWYQKTLFIRGVFNFIIQMKNGYKYLMKSMDVSGFLDEESEQPSEEQLAIEKELAIEDGTDKSVLPASPVADSAEITQEPKKIVNKAGETVIGVLGMVGGIALAIGLFMFVPNWTASFINSLFAADLEHYHSLIAGIIRIILFVTYMWAVSLMKEIRMTYEYHGAEHMTIAAYEAGEPLDPDNVENIKKYKRFHPRCGTSFIFIVLAISIIVYSILPLFIPIRPVQIVAFAAESGYTVAMWQANIIRTVLQILFLPVLVAVSYEIIKLAGRYDKNIIMRIISAPGIGLQKLTTRQPNDKQLEVAVTAMLPVIPDNKEEDKW
jgi:uncharacterized protein YqhQ